MKKAKAVTFQTVREMMMSLPGVTEGTSYGTEAFRVRNKLLARLHDDHETLVLSCKDRDVLIETYPKAFFVTKHYLNYPWILVRLGKVGRKVLEEVIVDAWRAAASAGQIKLYDSGAYEAPPVAVTPPRERNAELSAESKAKYLARVRAICESLPGCEEKEAWGSPTFRVKKKMFAMFVFNHHGDGRIALWLQAPSGVQQMLTEAEPEKFFVPPYTGPSGWIGVHLNRNTDEEVRFHVTQAYREAGGRSEQ